MQSTPRNQPAAPVGSALSLQPHAMTLLMLFTVLPIALAFWFSPTLAMALVFVGMCVFVAQKHYAFFVLAAFAVFPFQQSLSGENVAGNFSVSDLFLIVAFTALPMLCLSKRRVVVGPAGTPLLLFLSLSIVSSAYAWEGMTTAVSLARMWVATLLPVLLFANGAGKSAFAHRCFTLFLYGINGLSVASLLAFARGGVGASMATMGNNKNLLGPMFGCGIIIALTYLITEQAGGRRRTWLLLTIAGASVGSLLALSRGGWIATAAAVLLLFLMLRQIKVFAITLLVLAPVLFIVWGLLPEKATDYASDVSTKSYTIQARFSTMNQVMAAYEESPLIGVGVGLRKRMEPHNVLILTLGEEGLLGLCGFLAMFAGGFVTFAVAWRATRSDLQARQTVLIGACLLLLSLVAGMMDVYWRRGVGFLGWAGVGMAVSIIASNQQGRVRTNALPRGPLATRTLRGELRSADAGSAPEGRADTGPAPEGLPDP